MSACFYDLAFIFIKLIFQAFIVIFFCSMLCNAQVVCAPQPDEHEFHPHLGRHLLSSFMYNVSKVSAPSTASSLLVFFFRFVLSKVNSWFSSCATSYLLAPNSSALIRDGQCNLTSHHGTGNLPVTSTDHSCWQLGLRYCAVPPGPNERRPTSFQCSFSLH